MKRDTLLIIDDSELDLAILNEIFKNHFKVKCLSNAAQAMRFLTQNQHRICAVLLDICLGRKGAGFTVLQQIQQDIPSTGLPIILITSDAQKQYVVDGIARGAADFLVKPVDPHTVQTRVCATVKSAWPAGTTILDASSPAVSQDNAPLALLPRTLSAEDAEKIAAQWWDKLCVLAKNRPAISLSQARRIQKITTLFAETYVETHPDSGLSFLDATFIGCAAAFLDVGLLGLPDAVITDPDTPAYQEHTTIGRDFFLQGSAEHPFLHYCSEIAYWHHKNFDGTGYPQTDTSVTPPLCAQLVHTAMRCDNYAKIHRNHNNRFERMLYALSDEVGHIISEEMYSLVQSCQEPMSILLLDLDHSSQS